MNKKNISLSSPAPSVFDLNGSDLDERMFVVVIFPVSFVAMPIPIVMAMPVFVIPIVVPAVLVSSDREVPTTNPRARMDKSNVFIFNF
jgi:hypothetical protein